MRKLPAALLAVPILAVVSVGSLLRRSPAARATSAIALGAIIALGSIALARPTPTVATPPTAIVPLTQAAFRTAVATGVDLDTAATIEFSTPMDRASVAAAVTVDPPAGIDLRWNDDGTALTITPATRWSVGTYHTITVQPGALALTGRPLTTPARASFLTRAPASVALDVTAPLAKRVAVDTAFTISFDRAVDAASVRAAIRLDPPVEGILSEDTVVDGLPRFTFIPAERLRADTTYRLVVDGARDDDGLAIDGASLAVETAVAPTVERVRPKAKADDVKRDAKVSIHFSKPMDKATTKKAFTIKADGKTVAGKVTWAEKATVLIFTPKAKLPYDAKIVAKITPKALSAEGTPLAKGTSATFTTVAKPKPKAAPRATAPRSSGGGSSSGGGASSGGSTGSGSWTSVERYYLGLMNCTRTGGWVDSGGNCDSPGGRNVAALKLSSGISSKVARPYAKLLATRNKCTHFIGGNPGDRLRRAGYTSYRWAENIGCRSGGARSAVLGSHRYFQSEKSYNGGHYVNMMSSKYDRVGIGVWVSGGRVRLVVDFYHP
ncbi:MAG TPA: Ig-like domain-containing protein [Candidatus Saccharimonadales bacterium]|nr:Ig-like domain-containing protein [Candidatus Saccharimonadales bacterium]